MKVLIKVTKEILERSKMCTSKIVEGVGFNCAISLAIREIFPNAWVGGDINLINMDYFNENLPKLKMSQSFDEFMLLLLLEESRTCIIKLPIEAQDFIEDFDNNSAQRRVEMEPISFEINVPDEIIEEIGINEVYKVLSESKTLEMVMN